MPICVQEVQMYIESHLDQIKTPDEIATAFGVPLDTLRKVFRREAGIPLMDFLRQQRVERAKRLLGETNLGAAEVGRAVGWTREDTAAHVFRRLTGETMQAYRRRVRIAATD